MADAPRDDMGRVHCRVAIGSQHPYAAKSTSMIVDAYHSPAKALVAHLRLIVMIFSWRFFDLLTRLFDQMLTVCKSL